MLIDTAEIPGGGFLQLCRYGDDYEILYGGEQLMGNWATQSEAALATLVCERLGDRARHLLIGGLGMGFTLSAAITAAPADAVIDVVELVPGVVAWAQNQLAHLVGRALADTRVTLTRGDVHDVIDQRRDTFDAILLDVDNGPDGLISLANERLYSRWGLRSAYAALRPGGILAIWSACPDATFGDRLRAAAFAVEEIVITAGDEAEPQQHTIWLASRSAT